MPTKVTCVFVWYQVNGDSNVMTSQDFEITWEAEDAESDIETCWISGKLLDMLIKIGYYYYL